MKLLQQILAEAGADMGCAITLIPSFGAYFKGVKRVEEYSEEKIILIASKKRWKIEGENLAIDKYFEQDLFIRGEVKGVCYE